jgi:hypothetical protein
MAPARTRPPEPRPVPWLQVPASPPRRMRPSPQRRRRLQRREPPQSPSRPHGGARGWRRWGAAGPMRSPRDRSPRDITSDAGPSGSRAGRPYLDGKLTAAAARPSPWRLQRSGSPRMFREQSQPLGIAGGRPHVGDVTYLRLRRPAPTALARPKNPERRTVSYSVPSRRARFLPGWNARRSDERAPPGSPGPAKATRDARAALT